MPEFRDDLDAWLDRHVQPLLPPPGTFELIRKRARRRKLKHAALSAVAAAAVVAVAAVVPQVVISQFGSGRKAPTALASRHASTSTTVPGSTAPSSLVTGGVHVTTPPVIPPVPPRFLPSSVTFVGPDTGWVIGQAGIPGHCATAYCTSIARTDNGGKTWYGARAPITGPPDGPQGVSQIRFLNTHDGWAFGPELWATHDGGRRPWTKIDTAGLRVTALETVGTRAFAIWARCSGRGPDFAADCTDFSLYSVQAGRDNWAPVPGASHFALAGTRGSASLLLARSTGYLLPPSGILVTGPTSGTANWQPASAAAVPQAVPCSPGAAQPDGQPSQAMIASTGPQPYLVLLCASTPAGTATQDKTLYYSTDGGNTWQQGAAVPAEGVAMSLSGSPGGRLVLATNLGIEVAASVTSPLRPAPGRLPAGGFTFVGMTETNQGVAVPADTHLHTVWFTYDGGLTWRRSPVR